MEIDANVTLIHIRSLHHHHLPVCGVPFQTGKIHCWIVKRLTRRLNSQFQNVREWEPINDCRVCVRRLRAMSLMYIITWANWATLSNTMMLLVAQFIQLMVIFGDHVVFVSICHTSNENVFIWFPIRPKSRQVNQLIHFAPFKLTKLTASPPSVRPRDSFESRFGECVWCCCFELRTSKRSNACRPQAANKNRNQCDVIECKLQQWKRLTQIDWWIMSTYRLHESRRKMARKFPFATN